MNLKFVTTLLSILACLPFSQTHATPTYGFALGMSLENVVIPGSIVTIPGSFMNTGEMPIVFDLSTPGRRRPALGISRSPVKDWSILENSFTNSETAEIFNQFNEVVVNPNEVFDFVFGTFRAPNDLPLESQAIHTFGLITDITLTVRGSTLGRSMLLGEVPFPSPSDFNNEPTVRFTLGTQASTSDKTFFDAQVVDLVTGEIISGPTAPAPTPEPSTLLLFISGLTALRLFRGKRRN